jgi:hypothetical protein
VNSQVLRVAWYRFRVTFARRWGGYLTVVLLIGLLGGLGIGAVAGARRTQSSYPAFLASTNPSDLIIAPQNNLDARELRKVAHLPDVKRVESVTSVNTRPAAPALARRFNAANTAYQVDAISSQNGLFFTQDRVGVIQGTMANPKQADQVVMTAAAAQIFRLHVGEVVPLDIYTNKQTTLPGYADIPTPFPPYARIDVKLVGIVVFNASLIQDDVNRYPTYVLFTPALTREFAQCCSEGAEFFGLKLSGGSRDIDAVNAEIDRTFPGSISAGPSNRVSVAVATAERAIKPESIALGVFGGIVGLAVLFIVGQVIGRQLRFGADEESTLRALGASPRMTTADGLVGIVGAVVIGSLLAVVVAVGLSPLTPIGPVRPVYPTPGFAFDWTVLGLGLLALVLLLGTLAFVLALRGAPHRQALRRQWRDEPGSAVARAAAGAGMPLPAVAGIRFALEPGVGRNSVPVRSAILGAALAVMVVIATGTFGASLDSLVSHPNLYGWNWNFALNSAYGGGSEIPLNQVAELLDHDRDVAAWTGVNFVPLVRIDGQTVPVMAGRPGTPVQPPILSGHRFEAANEVVVGATTLANLHKRVGQTVTVSGTGINKPRRLVIAGTATMPAVGLGFTSHLEMGTGALLSDTLVSAEFLDGGNGSANNGPSAIFVRLRDGANAAASLHSLQRIASVVGKGPDGGVTLTSLERPAEIVNYRSTGSTPAFLGAGLAAGAVVALGLTLIASVRRRRRDLALLKTLGFTGRQLASAVAWQSSIAVVIGTAVGVPLGIVLGRIVWDLFAHQINVVPAPSVPVLLVVLIALGALVVANLVAAIPGRLAARTPTALLLRAE